jgi:hypothetical protein
MSEHSFGLAAAVVGPSHGKVLEIGQQQLFVTAIFSPFPTEPQPKEQD